MMTRIDITHNALQAAPGATSGGPPTTATLPGLPTTATLPGLLTTATRPGLLTTATRPGLSTTATPPGWRPRNLMASFDSAAGTGCVVPIYPVASGGRHSTKFRTGGDPRILWNDLGRDGRALDEGQASLGVPCIPLLPEQPQVPEDADLHDYTEACLKVRDPLSVHDTQHRRPLYP
jgi:hypothetical protein